MKLQNKIALITGGNSGIGLATAKLFVSEGARVAIIGRNQASLDKAAKDLGPNVLAIRADIADYSAMSQAIETTVQRFNGKLDIIFANAGISDATPLGATEIEKFENILRVNVTSVFAMLQSCRPHLNNNASIILNGSVMSINGRPGFSAYAASKGAIRAMGRVLASELSPLRVRVNVVSPGAVDTPIWSPLADTPEKTTALFARLGKAIPLERIADSSEVAKAVLFLASEDSSYVQAAEIVVDGGSTGAPAGAPIYRG